MYKAVKHAAFRQQIPPPLFSLSVLFEIDTCKMKKLPPAGGNIHLHNYLLELFEMEECTSRPNLLAPGGRLHLQIVLLELDEYDLLCTSPTFIAVALFGEGWAFIELGLGIGERVRMAP